jgi:hypothetical protein
VILVVRSPDYEVLECKIAGNGVIVKEKRVRTISFRLQGDSFVKSFLLLPIEEKWSSVVVSRGGSNGPMTISVFYPTIDCRMSGFADKQKNALTVIIQKIKKSRKHPMQS